MGRISDNLGSHYQVGGSFSNTSIMNFGWTTVENFSKEADTLIISYDYYNRSYKVEFPLKAGDKNE